MRGKENHERGWHEYNEELVVRGKFYLDFDFVDNWKRDLERMNEGKVGRPFKFPDGFVKWQAVWHQWIDYRGLERIARRFREKNIIPQFDDYTTIWYRVSKFAPEIKLPTGKELEIGTDGTGMRMANGGVYREFKYGKKKGRKKYVVVTITADVKRKKLLDFDVHIEGEGDSEPKSAIKHMKKLRKAGNKIKKFHGDGKFDTNDMFDNLGDAKSAIKIRKNAKLLHTKSERRKREIRKYRKLGYKRWAKKTKYGNRWPATEGIFSAVKRKFGENLVSKKKESLINEAAQRFWVYHALQSLS